MQVLGLVNEGAECGIRKKSFRQQRLFGFGRQLLADIDRALLAAVRVPFRTIPVRTVGETLTSAFSTGALAAGFPDLFIGVG